MSKDRIKYEGRLLFEEIDNPDEYYADLYKKVQAVYLSDNRPWVIGYSGGKDSTATLQLVWVSLSRLSPEKLTKKVYIISSDTFVETPIIEAYIGRMHKQINHTAKKENLPFEAFKVTPKINDTFWVNIIGRGYPAPYSKFRWCTDRLKIEPANLFITEKVAAYGEVIVVLGARFSESASRSGSMAKRKKIGCDLTRHSSLPNAWVYTPIEDWYTEEVWEFLLSVQSPWGSNNHDLVEMYKNAQDGECPLVIDKSTPPCGNSRFGCWTCTVVKKDISMESTIQSGEVWLKPLLEFRDWLVSISDPELKKEIRTIQRRNGKIQYFEINGQKRIIWGPYLLSFRKEILKKLLETQNKIQKARPDFNIILISDTELKKIRDLWLFEEGDWEDSLPSIYEEITKKKLNFPIEDWAGMGVIEKRLLDSICMEHGLPIKLLTELFDAERKQSGMSRRSAIFNDIDSILKKDWRSKDEIFNEIEAENDLHLY
jgi:DNA sulfur modification protein DndC